MLSTPVVSGTVTPHTPVSCFHPSCVKVVLAGSMWNTPHIVILDEPTNYLDRDSLGAMAEAINEYEGGVVIISHNAQFVDQVCPEVWHLENHTLNLKGSYDWLESANKEAALTHLRECDGDRLAVDGDDRAKSCLEREWLMLSRSEPLPKSSAPSNCKIKNFDKLKTEGLSRTRQGGHIIFLSQKD